MEFLPFLNLFRKNLSAFKLQLRSSVQKKKSFVPMDWRGHLFREKFLLFKGYRHLFKWLSNAFSPTCSYCPTPMLLLINLKFIIELHRKEFIKSLMFAGHNLQTQDSFICFQIVHQLEQVVISLIAKVLELSVMGKD